MKSLVIERYSSSKNGVQSRVIFNSDEKEWHGLERPWLDNLPFESCIPSGVYSLQPWTSPKFGEAYIFIGGTVGEMKGDGDRFACLIHPANFTRQLQGCLALGKNKADYYKKEDSAAVWSSRDALNEFKETVGYTDPIQAIIKWAI